MEAVGAAASILAIAGAGIQVSLKLIAFADQVGTAPQRIQDVGTDVSVTAGTLQELGELMKKKTPFKGSTGMFKPDQVQNIVISSTKCKRIFDELKEILGKASQQLRNAYKSTSKSKDTFSRIRLSRLERMKWPFLQPSIQSLRSALGAAKATLTLILQVVHLRYAHVTASLNQEEQNDLIRMIAAMKRQQLASTYGGGGGDKGLDASDSDSDTENSDSRGRAEVGTVLEAWSITPNTLPDSVLQHLLVTPIPISQQQIEKILRTSPQDFREIASIIDSLSSPERDTILGKVLRNNHFYPHDSTIRSISRESWTGSHVLFGKVTSRKFRLIIERRVEKPRSSRAPMHEAQNHRSDDHHYPTYVNYSDSDEIHDTEAYTHDPRVSPSPNKAFGPREEGSGANATSDDYMNNTTAEQTRYHARKQTKMGCLTCRKRRIKCDEERPTCKNCIKSKRECEGYVPRVIFKDPLGTFSPTQQGIAARTQRPARETVQLPVETRKKHSSTRRTKPIIIDKTRPHNARKEEPCHFVRKGHAPVREADAPSRSWTEPQSAREISDDQLVKNLLAEYTNFELDETLVQSNATPPPTYDEDFIAPKRISRPY